MTVTGTVPFVATPAAGIFGYPPEHPKYRSAVLGQRGMNVIGELVYKGAFNRQLHERHLGFNKPVALQEAIDFGKHHPCVVWRQVSSLGQVAYLGGLLGQDMYLENFLTLVLHIGGSGSRMSVRSRRAAIRPARQTVRRACRRTASAFCGRTD